MDVVQIFTVILIASASALCIALIFYLNKIVKSVQSVDNNVKELTANLKPLIQSSLELSENLSKITSDAKEQLKISRSVINDVRERADRILNFEIKVRTGIEDAIMPLVNNLNAIGKGIDTFWRSFKSK
ncbi:MAG: hypothetical protein M5U17_12345 [Ignavibacterium sp.]|nr:hypothetical protein [Ignavibacterium sp.]